MSNTIYFIQYEQFVIEGDSRAGFSGYKYFNIIKTEEDYIKWWDKNIKNIDQNNRNFEGHIKIIYIEKANYTTPNHVTVTDEVSKFKKIQEDKFKQQEIEQAQRDIQQLQEKIKKLTS